MAGLIILIIVIGAIWAVVKAASEYEDTDEEK
jgi:hypothetical protein